VLREGQAASAGEHPNIVRIEDLGIDDQGVPYLVQEFLDGIDLATYAQYRRGPCPARDLIPLMLPIFDALGALHDAGVVHRDLKPENIFLVRDGAGWSPRLLDFGLARSSITSTTPPSASRPPASRSGRPRTCPRSSFGTRATSPPARTSGPSG
jgi:serine/threonine protein kinase